MIYNISTTIKHNFSIIKCSGKKVLIYKEGFYGDC